MILLDFIWLGFTIKPSADSREVDADFFRKFRLRDSILKPVKFKLF